jgi:hypothetical protein
MVLDAAVMNMSISQLVEDFDTADGTADASRPESHPEGDLLRNPTLPSDR